LVSTGGAILMDAPQDEDDLNQSNDKSLPPPPSHLAPFLTGLPPPEEEVIFQDFGKNLFLCINFLA
jgi:hypothetical protein